MGRAKLVGAVNDVSEDRDDTPSENDSSRSRTNHRLKDRVVQQIAVSCMLVYSTNMTLAEPVTPNPTLRLVRFFSARARGA